jgi:hypothetical protein
LKHDKTSHHKVPGLTPSEQDELKRLLMAIEATDIIYTTGDIKRYTALLVIKVVREEEVYKKYLTIENRHQPLVPAIIYLVPMAEVFHLLIFSMLKFEA